MSACQSESDWKKVRDKSFLGFFASGKICVCDFCLLTCVCIHVRLFKDSPDLTCGWSAIDKLECFTFMFTPIKHDIINVFAIGWNDISPRVVFSSECVDDLDSLVFYRNLTRSHNFLHNLLKKLQKNPTKKSLTFLFPKTLTLSFKNWNCHRQQMRICRDVLQGWPHCCL